MVKFVFILIIESLLCSTMGYPVPDEERYFHKEFNEDIINLFTAAQHLQKFSHPCKKYYFGNGFITTMPKRNSEIIISLLSLSKSISDAGK